jgi:hypothetical protein
VFLRLVSETCRSAAAPEAAVLLAVFARERQSNHKAKPQTKLFSRKDAKAQSLPGSRKLSLRLCAFAGEIFSGHS